MLKLIKAGESRPREAIMGEVAVEVELENAVDRELSERGSLPVQDIRHFKCRVLVDTGAVSLVLPQDLAEVLGLREVGKVVVTCPDERKEERPRAGIVTVRVGNRSATMDCIVGQPGSEPLLGQIPLESMDLLVDCNQQKLVPRPESPYLPTLKMK
ncbi:MAG: aspartyl protease family protein [Planctomycetales bacterium]|nr:aspartyl protease family protein [Planctomycetales bacterium]